MVNRIILFFMACLLVVALASCDAHRRENFIKENPNISGWIKSAIMDGKVMRDMTSEEVIASWGYPNRVNRSVGSWGVHEQWVYGFYDIYTRPIYIYFERGRVTSWQD